MCYIQLVSDVMSGFHAGQYLEGEGEASHRFTGLMSGTYTVLVYAVRRGETSCSPPHDPDYVTVASVTAGQHTPVTSIHVPVITHTPGVYIHNCIYDTQAAHSHSYHTTHL